VYVIAAASSNDSIHVLLDAHIIKRGKRKAKKINDRKTCVVGLWPSGLRRQSQDLFLTGRGSNPLGPILFFDFFKPPPPYIQPGLLCTLETEVYVRIYVAVATIRCTHACTKTWPVS
jgi:hypothetical protein